MPCVEYMPPTPSQLGEQVVARCRALGFSDAGVTVAEPIDPDHAEAYRAWIAEGRHAEMAYLARNVEVRLDPRVLLPGARSIIMVADQYHARETASSGTPSVSERDDSASAHQAARSTTPAVPGGSPRIAARVARYARGDDYHDVMKKRLHAMCDALRSEHPGHGFRAFVDTAPVMEREYALRAGLGWIGKHTLLINPRKGSWLFLGGVLTTLELEPPANQRRHDDHCGTCTRCIDACPTGAITPHSVDARRCISSLTIEQRSPIDPALQPQIGEWLYGCDVCQEVCPHNSPRSPGVDVGESNPAYAQRFESLDPLEILSWTPEDRARVLKGSAMKRATLEMLRRNARIVLANAGAEPPQPPGPA